MRSLEVCIQPIAFANTPYAGPMWEFASRKRDTAVSSIAPLQPHTKQPYKYTEIYKH